MPPRVIKRGGHGGDFDQRRRRESRPNKGRAVCAVRGQEGRGRLFLIVPNSIFPEVRRVLLMAFPIAYIDLVIVRE